jgi:hypothetical protein
MPYHLKNSNITAPNSCANVGNDPTVNRRGIAVLGFGALNIVRTAALIVGNTVRDPLPATTAPRDLK